MSVLRAAGKRKKVRVGPGRHHSPRGIRGSRTGRQGGADSRPGPVGLAARAGVARPGGDGAGRRALRPKRGVGRGAPSRQQPWDGGSGGATWGPQSVSDTMQISRGKLDRLHRTPAESTAWVCGGYGTSRTRARSSNPDCLIFGSCPSGRGFASALPSDGTSRSPPLRLASSLSPPDLGRGLAPPSCQACPAHTGPWTHRTRPPRLGKRCAFSTSFHRAFPIKSPTKNSERPLNIVGKPG